MRVIAGTFRGRRLQAPPGTGTRPTSDRVREALFSALGVLEGLAVLDLYAGSGALGIEALSRGAASAVFVERDRAALRCLRANLDLLGLDPGVAKVVAGDAGRTLDRLDTYDLVFLDPPYRDAPTLGPVLTETLPAVLNPGARVVTESDRRHPLDLDLHISFDRRYGDTLIRIHSA